MMPEQKARVSIDALLASAGWHVCNLLDANIHAARGVALRKLPLNPGHGKAAGHAKPSMHPHAVLLEHKALADK